ncbi:biopolymer transporter ExbD [Ramlibacter sp.]|uniref:ExbD/TolR family protein n=1 Tax=Ramlibacter sp. TaxID=1917967 RepID=UPI002D260ECE|nr:biopolymer transporter ExbD [Ramlibacter sp.]HYD76673.1 biopolymer transporter ExbD [Ramlibacter sp.]
MAFGRLERSEAPRPISDINVTPMVDVMLVLVVILIITAPLMASSLRLDLPRAEAARPTDAPRFVTVGIDPEGKLFLDDKPVSSDQLAQGLAQAATRSRDTEVQLRADRTVPYGKVVEVMGAAQKAGLNRIGFVAEPQ